MSKRLRPESHPIYGITVWSGLVWSCLTGLIWDERTCVEGKNYGKGEEREGRRMFGFTRKRRIGLDWIGLDHRRMRIVFFRSFVPTLCCC